MVIKKRKRASLSTSPPTKYLIKSLEEKLKLTSNPFAQFKSSVEALFSNYHTFPLNFQSKILDSVGYLNIIKEMNLFVDTNYSLVPSIDELTFTFSNGNGRCSTLTEILVHYQHFQDILSTNGSLFLQKGYPIDQPLFERVRMKWYSLVDHHLSSLVQRIHRDMLDTTPQVLLDQIQSTLQTLFDSQKVFGNKLAVEGEVMVNHLSDYLVSYYCSLIDSITRNDPIVMGVMDILTCHLNLFLSVARLQEDMGKSVIRVGILYLEYLSLKRQEDVFMRLLKVGVGYIGVCVRMERDDPDGMIDRFKVSMID